MTKDSKSGFNVVRYFYIGFLSNKIWSALQIPIEKDNSERIFVATGLKIWASHLTVGENHPEDFKLISVDDDKVNIIVKVNIEGPKWLLWGIPKVDLMGSDTEDLKITLYCHSSK